MWEVIIAGAAAVKVPGLFDAAVRSTGEKLLGPVLDLWAQPVKDRAMRRARMSQAIADAAAREVGENPEQFRQEIDALLQQSGKRAERVGATFKRAIEHIGEAVEAEGGASPSQPADDWLNRWSRYVEDASSAELQDAFARILAGEITRKGSFSIATLRVVSELSQKTASEFQKLWSAVIDDYAVKYADYSRGEDWQRLLDLREVGLISASDASIHRPQPPGPRWGFGALPHLLVEVEPHTYSEVPIINLTGLGRELGSILPPPNIEANLRKLAVDCPDRRGWLRATLIRAEGGTASAEVLWQVSA